MQRKLNNDVHLRIDEELLAKLDRWRRNQMVVSDRFGPAVCAMPRGEAIRLAIKQMVSEGS